jgi:hypothetical protein
MNDEVEATIERVRARVAVKTLIQDISEPLTGTLDQRRIASKFINLETAVGDLAEATDSLNAKLNGKE